MTYRRPQCVIDGKVRLVSRMTMERHLGRPLLSSELVHHRDRNPFNNAIENLQIVTRAEHKRIHAEIGAGTRLPKVWHLDGATLWARVRGGESARSVAQSLGCSEKTVTRAIKEAVPDADLKALISQRMKGKYPAHLTHLLRRTNHEAQESRSANA